MNLKTIFVLSLISIVTMAEPTRITPSIVIDVNCSSELNSAINSDNVNSLKNTWVKYLECDEDVKVVVKEVNNGSN